jgi:hypothetical protein
MVHHGKIKWFESLMLIVTYIHMYNGRWDHNSSHYYQIGLSVVCACTGHFGLAAVLLSGGVGDIVKGIKVYDI